MTQALAATTPSDLAYIAVNGEGDITLQELLDANFNGKMPPPHKLDRINVPAGGGLSWEIPNAGDSISTRELTGIILHRQLTRLYFPNPYGGGKKEAPTCKSEDGIIGVGTPGGTCGDCPLGQFTGDKRPACQEKELVYLLLPERLLPAVLVLPATSLKGIRDYSMSLLQVAKPLYGVETKFTLTRREVGGNKFSVAVPTKTDTVISPADRQTFKAMKDEIIGFLRTAAATGQDS